MVNTLVKLFNQITETETVPIDWSTIIVTQVHKKGHWSLPSNYKAISVLSILGKAFHKILLERMLGQGYNGCQISSTLNHQ